MQNFAMLTKILELTLPSYRLRRRTRELKYRFWQSTEAASIYADNVSTMSPGMQTELHIAQAICRGRVLDLGAGTGRFSRKLAEAGLDVTAADISDAMLQQGLRESAAPYQCVVADALNLEFPDECFDSVISFWLLVHFAEWDRILHEMIRVARPGALIAFEISNAAHREASQAIDPATAAKFEKINSHETWLHEQEVRSVLQKEGCSLVFTRTYDVLNSNFLAMQRLGNHYEDWRGKINALVSNDPSCRDCWHHFEANELQSLDPSLGRKRIFVAQKSAEPTIEFSEIVPVSSPGNAEFKLAMNMFVDVFRDRKAVA